MRLQVSYTVLMLRQVLVVFSALTASAFASSSCLGEYQQCPSSGDCVLDPSLCGRCKQGQYLCPLDQKTCVDLADAYKTCPDIKGTHFDWTMSIDDRLAHLVKTTNITEQIAQLTNDAPAIVHAGIPAYNWLNDDEHGVRQSHATSFPNGCALGATWSKRTLREVGYAIGMEARGLHNGFVHAGNRGHRVNGIGITMYSPNMNMVRDPRWGRAQEVYSEDPNVAAQLTYNFVVGAQGNFSSTGYLLAAACCKHYAAYDLESEPRSRFTFDAQVDSRNMWETYMVNFRHCVVEAQAAHVMCSYNAVNGVPACGNPDLLNGILRDQWKWPGFVVTDYDAWAQIALTHRYCPDLKCAAAVGLKAGTDQEGGGTGAINQLASALADNNVTAEQIQTAFRRLFRVRILLGMLDPPMMVAWNMVGNDSSNIESPEHIALARRAGQEAMTLYKNHNKALPFSISSIKKMALIGSSATQTSLLLGNYAVPPDAGIVSIMQGIENAFGLPPTKPNCTVEQDIDYFVQGEGGTSSPNASDCCVQCMNDATCQYYTWYQNSCYLKTSDAGRKTSEGRISGKCLSKGPSVGKLVFAAGCSNVRCTDTSGFDQATDAAKDADAIVIVLGLDQSQESEGHDRSVVELPGNQAELVAAVRKANPNAPLVVVLVHGGTLALGSVLDDADAIVDAWYPGMQGGNAVADVLFGKYNPAGRAAVTSYLSTSDLPTPGMMDLYAGNGSKGLTYRFFAGKPQYPFGYGMSYTTFSYSNLQLNDSKPKACDVVGVTVTVHNEGDMDGDEVVQVYVKQPKASGPVPNVRLADFARVFVPKGQSTNVSLAITPEFHAYVPLTKNPYTGSAEVSVEAGPLNVYVGGGQPDYFEGHLSAVANVQNTQLLVSC
ncbi:uncharacterized protein [Oscarella lobularis]|uniref:uncharacterized protein n=1 Tax=Oscarella lobularis TaxID=121494 RepID=UPI0033138017